MQHYNLYVIELRKMCVICQWKLAKYNKQMLQTANVSLFQILSAMFLPNIIWMGLQLGKLSQK